MSKKFGFDLLRDQALDDIEGDLDWAIQDAIGDTEIEKLFFAAIYIRVRFGFTECTDILVPKDDAHYTRLLDIKRAKFGTLIITPQAQLEGWRVDFLFTVFDWRDPNNGKWRSFIVECDGHNFHERTKEQAARDRSRDRGATLAGLEVLRFTGSEIWRNPWGCAEEALLLAVRGWG